MRRNRGPLSRSCSVKVKSNTKESRMNISRQGSSGKSKKIAENDKVKYALQELQSVEDSAKCNVLKTLAMKEVAGLAVPRAVTA